MQCEHSVNQNGRGFSFVTFPSGTVLGSSLVTLHMTHNSCTLHQTATQSTRMDTTPSKLIIPRDPGAPVHRRKKARLHFEEEEEKDDLQHVCYWCTKPIPDDEVTDAFSDNGIFKVHYGTCTENAQNFLDEEFEEEERKNKADSDEEEETGEFVWDPEKFYATMPKAPMTGLEKAQIPAMENILQNS